tara:strand:- start:585 stop:1238 length:654 start_codon:yes stop_codon:yes gene_type:complete
MKLIKISLTTYSEMTATNEAAPLYVVNTSNVSENGRNQQIALHLSVTSESGNLTAMKIPATWIPIDLTTKAPRSVIVRSPNFRDLLNKGLIAIVAATATDEQKAKGLSGAADVYKDQSVLDEFAAIFSADYLNTDNTDDGDTLEIGLGKVSSNVNSLDVSDVALSIVSRAESDESVQGILRTIRQNTVSLTPKDLEYITAECSDASIKSLCAELLNS